MTNPIPDLTGYIFKDPDGANHWKITGAKFTYTWGDRYPTIKCTKLGKEFTRCNKHVASMIEQLYRDGMLVKCGLTEDVKVSTDGKASGIRKRRIQHLEAELNTLLAEVNKLLAQEKAPYEHKLTVVDIERV